MKVLHIFNYGETQFINGEINIKKSNSLVPNLNNFVNYIISLKPENLSDKEFHVIHIFEGMRVMYLAKENEGTYILKWNEINQEYVTSFVNEVENLISQE